MVLLDALKHWRMTFADRLLGGLPIRLLATKITRLSVWCCFLAAMARLMNRIGWSLALLIAALVFDMFDGVAARRDEEDNPQTDWAADRYGEAIFIGPLFYRGPLWVALMFSLAYCANVFLPRQAIPILPLRHALVCYFVFLLLRW